MIGIEVTIVSISTASKTSDLKKTGSTGSPLSRMID
jgi:hypothetical protein